MVRGGREEGRGRKRGVGGGGGVRGEVKVSERMVKVKGDENERKYDRCTMYVD